MRLELSDPCVDFIGDLVVRRSGILFGLRRRSFIARLGDRTVDERKACQRCAREAYEDGFFHFMLQ